MVLDRGRKPDSVCKHVLFDLHSDLKLVEPIFKNKKITLKKFYFRLPLEIFKIWPYRVHIRGWQQLDGGKW